MRYFPELWDDFISLLFPRLCFACGDHLLRNEKIICTGCYVEIPRTNYHLSDDNPVARLFWGRCLIEKAAAFSFYTRGSRISKLIHNLKYNGIREIGPELGRIYALTLGSSGFTQGMDIIIPVPLHPSRQRQRGFNQSDSIALGVSEVTGLPLCSNLVSRVSVSGTQTRRSRYERWTNVEGIFNVTDPGKVAGRHVLLVDDVITTGSTIESCAGELLKIGGVKVSVVALAYAVV
ncbi:MAG: ComF family protein [Bacteroidales bacterium]